ncbi:hypothetical protein pipiens_011916 [Culex pipiens pipiens]|uniref:Chitin-binding type-2 domain-containing protein n=1 Tax=Culex pipiens pipiens TaxID=38569 RepID=A0ABD1D4G2_CULPP
MLSKLVVFVALVQLSQIRADFPGYRLNRTVSAIKKSVEPCDGLGHYSTCTSCDTVQVCLGTEVTSRHCGSLSPDKPYCNNGQCSGVPTFEGACQPQPIWCSDEGFFPDPFVCQMFHYCQKGGFPSEVYQCPGDSVFNPDTLECRKRENDAQCMVINCKANEVFSKYGTSERFFGYCAMQVGYATAVRVFRCAEGTKFDGQKCVYDCTTEGRFADVRSQYIWYECVRNEAGQLESITNKCPWGRVVDINLGVCIPWNARAEVIQL